MRQLGDREILGAYEGATLTGDLREVLDSNAQAPVIRVDGLLRYDEAGRAVRVVNALQVELFEVDGQPWSGRFIELATLDEGWQDGLTGDRIQFSSLDASRDLLKAFHDEGRALPGIFPMEDGGVQLEWASPSFVTSVEISPDLDFSLYHLVVEGRQSESLDTQDFSEAVDFLRRVVAR